MSFAEEMMNLGENLAKSSERRLEDVSRIFRDTHKTRRDNYTKHHEMAKNQRRFLGNFVDHLATDTDSLLSDFAKRHEEMRKKQTQFLRGFVKKTEKEVTDFLGECSEKQQSLRKMFDKAHDNFQRAMGAMARSRSSFHFPTFSGLPRPGKTESPAGRNERGPQKKRRGKRRVA